MSSQSPDHALKPSHISLSHYDLIEEYKLFADQDPLLQDSPSRHDDEDYDFLATASVMNSQASPSQHYRGCPQVLDLKMNTADKPKGHKYRPDHHALENEDLGAYLVQTDDVPFRDEQNAIAYSTAGVMPNGEEDQLQT